MSENYVEKKGSVETDQATNKMRIRGVFEKNFEYSHQIFGERFYKTRIITTRRSGENDYVPVIVSEDLLDEFPNLCCEGLCVNIEGEFRSYNQTDENGDFHLLLFLFAKSISKCGQTDEKCEKNMICTNTIYLDGYICKKPVYRTTPLGREIADVLIAVNRKFNKSDYIPCIAWGRAAKYISTLEIGSRIQLYGRVQSRQYLKRFSDNSEEGETRETYEVSIMRLNRISD